METKKTNDQYTWWGAPKKFSTDFEERKISWLELFYDLIYVIAIATITHHVSEHLNFAGMLDFFYLFTMIFWGWLNGSLYHDLHGTTGLRTKLMTLWQMMIVAALVITLNTSMTNYIFNSTIVVMIMQFYITYLWWSVGIYDKAHRKLNVPYTVLYLLSLVLMFVSLFVEQEYVRPIFYLTLVLNYLPPFITQTVLKRKTMELNLSSSMTERLGLFTIIIFGEVVLGVISGTKSLNELNGMIWINFGLGIGIVFSLWWLFFTLVSDRNCKSGFIKASLLEILYIPTLLGLVLLGAAFRSVFKEGSQPDHHAEVVCTFGYSLSLFLLGVSALLAFLQYPKHYIKLKKETQGLFVLTAILFFVLARLHLQVSITFYLILIQIIFLILIVILNLRWYRLYVREKK